MVLEDHLPSAIADILAPPGLSVIDNETQRLLELLADVSFQSWVRGKDLLYLMVKASEVSLSSGNDVQKALQLGDGR